MKVSSSFAVRHDPEVIRNLVKDFFTTSLAFYVPHMSQAAQNEIFKDFPQLKGKNYAQIMGDHSILDYPKNLNLTGKVVMLVDDSTTGGRKQIELAKKLRAAGAVVNVSLVLFEPRGKGARDKLSAEGITLHAIIEGPSGNY